MTERAPVVIVGDIILDMIAHIPRYPPPGGDGIARRMLVKSGGSAANTARALARCGVATRLIARLGNDVLARQALAELDADGVDTASIQRDRETSSGIMFITVTPDGQRTMFGYRGANAHTSPADLDLEAIRAARWLHVSGYALLESPQKEAALRAIAAADDAGVRISLDPGLECSRYETALLASVLPRVSVLFPTEDELVALAGQGDTPTLLGRLDRQGVGTIALKQGADGCIVYRGGSLVTVPAFPVLATGTTGTVDTTGAGDAFAAGFIAGQLHGLGLRACGIWANALGALAASVEGSYAAEKAELASFLRQQAREPGWRGWEGAFTDVVHSLERQPFPR